MSETWLISGSPGCGKTSWILDTFKNHQGVCGYIRLKGFSEVDIEQAAASKIDFNYLKDQIPELVDLNFGRLQLVPLRASNFLEVDEINFLNDLKYTIRNSLHSLFW